MSPRSPAAELWDVAGLTVEVRRSAKRRTLALQVRGGEVVVYAPATLPDSTIRGFVTAKRDWVQRHLTPPPAPNVWQDGDPLPFLGELLTLRLVPSVTPHRVGDTLFLPAEDVTPALEHWTRAAVLPAYAALVRDYAERLGAGERLRSVRVSRTRSRWGSCTAAGDIRLHWALSRAPLRVLHYVALHEAAHLLEMNHSPRYWAHVARLMPDHAEQRRWLREQGESLLR